ncbi:MAG: histidine kinase [Chloroflexota bacterium]|nr:histidine kinase [Chloroflexota bacterium]
MELPPLLRGVMSRISPSGRDRIAAVLVGLIALVEVLASDVTGPPTAVAAQSLVITSAIAWRRSHPLGAIGVAVLAEAVSLLVYSGTESNFLLAPLWTVLLLSYSVAAYEEHSETALAGALLLLTAFWLFDDLRQRNPPSEYLASLVGVFAPWLAGRAVAGARRQAERLREANRQLALERRRAVDAAAEAERGHIARELHDIVAHSLSVIAIQADAAEGLLPGQPEPAQRAVAAIRDTAQGALVEMRRLLGTLRSESERRPEELDRGLGDLDALIAEAGPDGRRVELRVEGEPIALPAALDRSAYRILQEGLTNARRHADGAACYVTVRYGEEALELSVLNSAGATDHVASERGWGFGLVGVRERVAAFGGNMSAGPEPAGGWALRTRLPLEPPC